MLSSRHVGLQGGCVGVGCLVSDTPGAPHVPHGVACSWTAAMQGMHRSGPPRRSRVDSAACSCHTFRGRIMYDRITVVDSASRAPGARRRHGGRAFAIRARLLSLTRHPFGRAKWPTAVGPGTRDRSARWRALVVPVSCSSCTLHLPFTFTHLSANFATVGVGGSGSGRARGAGGKR